MKVLSVLSFDPDYWLPTHEFYHFNIQFPICAANYSFSSTCRRRYHFTRKDGIKLKIEMQFFTFPTLKISWCLQTLLNIFSFMCSLLLLLVPSPIRGWLSWWRSTPCRLPPSFWLRLHNHFIIFYAVKTPLKYAYYLKHLRLQRVVMIRDLAVSLDSD